MHLAKQRNPVRFRRSNCDFEMAEIVGLKDVPLNQQQPLRLSTRGVGELIRQLLQQGVRHIIIGVGGSSTNDGGIGMAEGLGYAFTIKIIKK